MQFEQTQSFKKSLPIKYNRLLVFGYWFVNHLKKGGKDC